MKTKPLLSLLFPGLLAISGCRPDTPEISASVPENGGEASEVSESAPEESAMVEKLKSIVVPRIEFVNTPLSDAVAYLVHRGRELDPEGEGINVVMAGELEAESVQVTLELTNVPLAEAVKYTAQLAGARITVEEHAIVFSPGTGDPTENLALFVEPAEAEALQEKLETLVVPAVEFHDTPLFDALDFLRTRAAELDVETPPAQRGVDIILDVPPDMAVEVEGRRITLTLSNVPLGEVFRYVTELVGLESRTEGNVIVISVPKAP